MGKNFKFHFRTFLLVLLLFGVPAAAEEEKAVKEAREAVQEAETSKEVLDAAEKVEEEAEVIEAAKEATEPSGNDEEEAPKAKISLETLLKNTLERNAEIQEAEGDVAVARAQLNRALAAGGIRGNAVILAAPIFKETGNALTSTSDLSNWGPFVKGTIELVKPLYTFGQLGNYEKAAEHQIQARKGQAIMKRDEKILQTKEFYYGFLMAQDLERLSRKLVSFLEEAVKEAEKEKKNKKDKVKPHDKYLLKTNLEDLRQKKLFATSGKLTAWKALAWSAATDLTEFRVGKRLRPASFEMKTLAEYMEMARKHRPEFRALKEGILARKHLSEAKSAQSAPVFFLGGFGSAAWTPNRTKQKSVFALDPYNRIQGGVGLGLKFDLEWGRHSAEAEEERAEMMKLEAKEKWAKPGIELEVKKAYWELEQAVKGLKIADERKRLGKKWFVSSAMGWSIGITEANDLMEALEGDGLARFNHIVTVYMHNMALANLSKAVGTEVANLNYKAEK